MRPVVGLLVVIGLACGLILMTNHLHKSVPPPYENPDSPQNTAPQSTGATKTFEEVKEGAVQATLEIEGRGTMKIEMYPKAAPKTVEHIVQLCKKNFYNGILFHRVESGFVAQAGDPTSKKFKPSDLKGLTTEQVSAKFNLGVAGSGKTVPLEAALPHGQFSVGLARSDEPDSGDSQFYLNLNANNTLDGKYCVFGRIVSGEDIAASIEIGDKITRFSVP